MALNFMQLILFELAFKTSEIFAQQEVKGHHAMISQKSVG
jgi:hypothetical protein